jgi:hypothetical protein
LENTLGIVNHYYTGYNDDLLIAGLAGMVLTRAAAENNPCTMSS